MPNVVDQVTQGQSFVAEADFFNQSGQPFATTQAPSYQVRDPDGHLITQGVGAQDSNNAFRWTATVTIPQTAPISNNQTNRYTIVWSAFNATTKETQTYTSAFTVNGAFDFDLIELDRLATERSPLIDSMAIDPTVSIKQLQITVRNINNRTLYDSGVLVGNQIPPPILSQGKNVYTYSSKSAVKNLTANNEGSTPDNVILPDAAFPNADGITPYCDLREQYGHSAGSAGFSPLCIEWAYVTDVGADSEFHFLYVVNTRIIILVNQLRRLIDKARSANPNPALQYTDVDLVEYLNQGIQLVNMLRPTMTNWTLISFPEVMQQGVIMAGAYCALSAQYLAEGEAAFEFSGQNVSLTVDRTQFISGALSQTVQAFIDDKIPAAKRLWLRTTGGNGTGPGGALGINFGATTNRTWAGNRADLYRRMLTGY